MRPCRSPSSTGAGGASARAQILQGARRRKNLGPGPPGGRRTDGADPAPARRASHAPAIEELLTRWPGGWSSPSGATCGSASEEAVLGVFCRRCRGAAGRLLGTVQAAAARRARAGDGPGPHRAAASAQEAWGMGPREPEGFPEGQALRAALEARPGARRPPRRPCSPQRPAADARVAGAGCPGRRWRLKRCGGGMETLASGETSAGAARFQGGAGRHGQSRPAQAWVATDLQGLFSERNAVAAAQKGAAPMARSRVLLTLLAVLAPAARAAAPLPRTLGETGLLRPRQGW